jgi:hypothetical protein
MYSIHYTSDCAMVNVYPTYEAACDAMRQCSDYKYYIADPMGKPVIQSAESVRFPDIPILGE